MKKGALLFITFIAVTAQVYFAAAQKLPVTQQVSLRAPATLKIDGKATEWDGQFQAYNKTEEIYYTMANDDENIYLVVHTIKPRMVEKILRNGLTLTVNNTAKKSNDAKENAMITYPLIKGSYVADILRKTGDKANYYSGAPFPEVLTRTDSTVELANKIVMAQATSINFKSSNEPADVISIYNEQHVKVAVAFDSKGGYTYELAVPLKYLGLTDASKFSYNIKLNAYETPSYFSDKVTKEWTNADPDLSSVTDFWGEYTLAKK